jgi:myo-inositol-1(or 4)-monophosphatase
MDYLIFLMQELTRAGELAQSYFGKVSGTTKPGNSKQVLTEADIAIGKQIVAAVRKQYPDHNIIDEEAGVIDNGSRYTWVIDPIEATSNFAAGLPQYGIMVGLLEDATPIAGGIIAPAYDKLYLAEKGKGATCNGERITVTSENNLSNVLVSLSADGHPDDPERTRRDYLLLAELALAARSTRDNNCEAVDTMYVAEGRYGGRVNMVSKIWDNVLPKKPVRSGQLSTVRPKITLALSPKPTKTTPSALPARHCTNSFRLSFTAT